MERVGLSIMPKAMGQLTTGFDGNILQACKNLIIHLRQEGRGIDEFLDYMKNVDLQKRQVEQSQKEAQTEYLEKAKKCKKCKWIMYLYPVNTGSRDQVGGNWKSQWICGNTDCAHEEYSLNDVETEMETFGLKGT